MNRIAGAIALSMAMVSALSLSAQAGYVVTLEEVGANVVATGNGPIDLTGLTLCDLTSFAACTDGVIHVTGSGLIHPADPLAILGSIQTGGPTSSFDVYTGGQGPVSFGTSVFAFTPASSNSGDYVGTSYTEETFAFSPTLDILVPPGYVSDAPLSDTSTYDNQTFATLEVIPGIYEWKWGSGANQNFTLEIGAVPEPPSLPLLAGALVGLVMLLRTRPCISTSE